MEKREVLFNENSFQIECGSFIANYNRYIERLISSIDELEDHFKNDGLSFMMDEFLVFIKANKEHITEKIKRDIYIQLNSRALKREFFHNANEIFWTASYLLWESINDVLNKPENNSSIWKISKEINSNVRRVVWDKQLKLSENTLIKFIEADLDEEEINPLDKDWKGENIDSGLDKFEEQKVLNKK